MGRSERREDKIIHVVFGPGGGRVRRDVTTGRAGDDTPSSDQASSGREPLTDVFSASEVSRLLGISPGRLRSLDKSGIASPSGKRHGRRAYTFQDVIALRAAQAMLSQNLRLRDVSRAVSNLRSTLPRVARPLAELRIVYDGHNVLVRQQEGDFDAMTGQMVFDFDVRGLRDDVVRLLRPAAGRERARTAYELYLRASQLDEDAETMPEAERLYNEAIKLDPWLAIAHTNLGNIRFRQGDVAGAQARYQKALELDPRQPEAQYNLGYLMLERGEPEGAVPLFEAAIKADPNFADAHFNLAMALEQVGLAERARVYWRSYVDLEPKGTWTDIAQRHL